MIVQRGVCTRVELDISELNDKPKMDGIWLVVTGGAAKSSHALARSINNVNARTEFSKNPTYMHQF